MKTCSVCCTDLPDSFFKRATSKCKCQKDYCIEVGIHFFLTKLQCLKKHIKVSLNKDVESLSCMICFSKIELQDLQKLDKKLAERYENLATMSYIEKLPEFRWCAQKRCGNGQIVEGLNDEDAKGIFFTCNTCKKKTCCYHRIPMHEGKTCDEFDAEISKNEDAKNQLWIDQRTKPCPKCKKPIEKNGGCNHMTCQKSAGGCGYEFCYLCLADFDKIRKNGNHEHKPTCRLYAPWNG